MKIEALKPEHAFSIMPLEHELKKRLRRFPACIAAPTLDSFNPEQHRIALRIGLAGQEGTLQQIIHTEGVIEAVHVFEALRSLGYVPYPEPMQNHRVHCLYVSDME